MPQCILSLTSTSCIIAQEYVSRPVQQPVIIISYEMFVRHHATVAKVNFDLVVCDEGHRLKNTSIKTTAVSHSPIIAH